MNVHHLELFYYVARHKGVSVAARHMPYGIQQPAISAQIIQLEDSLGKTLFTRRPFRLTKAGEELYQFVEPFFGGLEEMGQRLRGSAEATLRIGALETVLRSYMPQLIKAMRHRFPAFNFKLVPATVGEIEAGLLAHELDMGVAPLLGKRPEGIKQQVMIHVPMTLVVPESSAIKSAAALWKQDRIAEPLICGPAENAVVRLFQMELQKRKREWFPSIELQSQELIIRYAAEGFGIGLILFEPGQAKPDKVRLIPLKGFPQVPYGLLWTGMLSPLQRALMEDAEAIAKSYHALVGRNGEEVK